MRQIYDQHTHSWHSIDSETSPADNVEAALAAGLGGVTFTEHFDTHPDEWDTCRYDEERYADELSVLREAYRGRAFVGKGIEVCYQPERWDFILDFLSRHEFDLVLLSVHWTARGPIQERGWWEQFTSLEQAFSDYFLAVRRAVEDAARAREAHGARVFDVLGHFDLVKRYAVRLWNVADARCDSGLLAETMAACVEADLTPEVNTSLLRQGGLEPMPGPAVLAAYRTAGGEAMSLGSDAHEAAHVGADFDAARGLLRDAGIGSVARFEARSKRMISLD
jgi:histidinol-phosphatase (PHP family)